MSNYIFVENNELNGCGQVRCLTEGIQNIEVSEEVYNAYSEDSLRYIWDGEKIIVNPNYEKDRQERENKIRIAEIKYELAELDLKSIRPARAGETERLAELEAQAQKLRDEMKNIDNAREL